ncbi:MAG TPA: SRPBCC domain-containing protein [Pricia sp.]|nr:SRPBCC domain-containing protein [Pricia sp.]
MKDKSFNTATEVEKPAMDVFTAINDVRGWWSENLIGKTDEFNGTFTHRDRYLIVTFKITELSQRKIVWEVVSSHNNMFLDNLHEWEGTRIVFEISEKGNRTHIDFTHEGLTPRFECHKVCSKAWGFFITTSLKNFIETGKGDPISYDYASFTTSITVNRSAREVYEAVNNVRGWWLEDIQGDTANLNGEFKFYEGKRLEFHCRIIESVPFERIVWLVLDQNFRNTEKQEWKGTTVLFEILEKEGRAQLRFTHLGLVPTLDSYEPCQNAWGNYINLSLRNLIEEGKGQPNKW